MRTELVDEGTRLVQRDVDLESQLQYKETLKNFRCMRGCAIGSGLTAVVAAVASVVAFRMGDSWPYAMAGSLLGVVSLGGAVGVFVSCCVFCDGPSRKIEKIKLIIADPAKRQELTDKCREGSFSEIDAYMYREQVTEENLKTHRFLTDAQADSLQSLRNIWNATVMNSSSRILAPVKSSIQELMNSTWRGLIGPA